MGSLPISPDDLDYGPKIDKAAGYSMIAKKKSGLSWKL